jgi:CHAT domain-containing protein
LPRGTEREKPLALPRSDKPFEHPFYWAAFILIGDPE